MVDKVYEGKSKISLEEKKAKTKLRGVRRWLSKYVVFEKDAALKDPNWPYLWKHKK